mmetsp:Transcript_294/g.335  ORF Transcript_294/g.335 Transcript_294/m.335 type:complete len:273 (+) Transcript_294:31-849(+)
MDDSPSIDIVEELISPQNDHLLENRAQALPKVIYSFKSDTNQLHKTSLSSGKSSSLRTHNHAFLDGSSLCETSRGMLYSIGGMGNSVICLDTSRDYAPYRKWSTLSNHADHSTVFFEGFLYVIGGRHPDCERLDCSSEDTWTALPALPMTCVGISVIVSAKQRQLYALGGCYGENFDRIQRFDISSLSWELMELRLPLPDYQIPSFETDDEGFYVILKKNLYRFNIAEEAFLHVASLKRDCKSNGPSYWVKGKLFLSNDLGPAKKYKLSLGL